MIVLFDITLFAGALAVALGTIAVTLRAQLPRLVEVLAGQAEEPMPQPQARVIRLVPAPARTMALRAAA